MSQEIIFAMVLNTIIMPVTNCIKIYIQVLGSSEMNFRLLLNAHFAF